MHAHALCSEHKNIGHPFIFQSISSAKLVPVLEEVCVSFPCVAEWHCEGAFYITGSVPCTTLNSVIASRIDEESVNRLGRESAICESMKTKA